MLCSRAPDTAHRSSRRTRGCHFVFQKLRWNTAYRRPLIHDEFTSSNNSWKSHLRDGTLRAFIEVYDLASPITASAVSYYSALSYERRPDPSLKSIWENPELFPKIRNACAIAQNNGYDYIWIDSCCIDKSSSSELSESINSMYKWYALERRHVLPISRRFSYRS